MAEPFAGRLAGVVAKVGPLCVGLDPSSALLDAWDLDDDAGGVETLAMTVLESIHGVVGVVKPQVAFYERFGAAGYAVLERVLAEAASMGFLVIADAKRGDIPSTTAGYAAAWLTDSSPLAADAVTLSPYLGASALAPAFERAHESGRGVFVVVSSSNDEGRGVQTARTDGDVSVESGLLEELDATSRALDGGAAASGCIGAVIGAQRRVAGLESFGGPVLVVGLGTQGSTPQDVATLRGSIRHEALCVNVAREVLRAGPKRDAIRDAAASFADVLR